MSTTTTHIVKQEEDVNEVAVQLRDDDPTTPAEGQTWLNTSQNKLKLKKDNDIRILIEGHIGAAIQLQADGIIDAAKSRSYYKDSTVPFAVTATANIVEGVSVNFRITNTAANIKAAYSLTALNPTSIVDGSLFYINSAMDIRKYYVWFDRDGLGLSTPAIAGRTGIRVQYTAGRKNKSTVTVPAGSAFPANTSGSPQYFTLSSANNATNYYVWYNNNSTGGNPLLSGKTGIAVAILPADTAAQVASKTAAAIAAVNLDFTATAAGSTVTIENVNIGTCTATANVSVGGLTVSTLVVGAASQTATDVAVAIYTAMTATTVGVSGVADFTGVLPTTPTLSITNQVTGYTTAPTDVSSGMVPSVTVVGSGGYVISAPNNFYFDDSASLPIIQGGKSVLYRMFRSGSFILCAASQYTTP
jgi:hypothetical protein